VRETALLKQIQKLGVDADAKSVKAVLLYAADAGVEFYALDEWWIKRGTKIVKAL